MQACNENECTRTNARDYRSAWRTITRGSRATRSRHCDSACNAHKLCLVCSIPRKQEHLCFLPLRLFRPHSHPCARVSCANVYTGFVSWHGGCTSAWMGRALNGESRRALHASLIDRVWSKPVNQSSIKSRSDGDDLHNGVGCPAIEI